MPLGDLAALWDAEALGVGDASIHWRTGAYSARAWLRDNWDLLETYASYTFDPQQRQYVRDLYEQDPVILKIAVEDWFRDDRDRIDQLVGLFGDPKKSRIGFVTGDRGGGKTGLVHGVGYAVWKRQTRPIKWLSQSPVVPPIADARIRTIEEAEDGDLILGDEAGLMAPASQHQQDHATLLSQSLQTLRHIDASAMFIAPSSAATIKNIPRYVDVWLFKAGGFGVAFERPEVRKLREKLRVLQPHRREVARTLVLSGDYAPFTVSMGLVPYWSDAYSKTHGRVGEEEALWEAWEMRHAGMDWDTIEQRLRVLGVVKDQRRWRFEVCVRNGGRDPHDGRRPEDVRLHLKELEARGEEPPPPPRRPKAQGRTKGAVRGVEGLLPRRSRVRYEPEPVARRVVPSAPPRAPLRTT